MLKKYMVLLAPDVNIEGSSSTSSATTASQSTDVKTGDSSASQTQADANKSAASTANKGDVKVPETLAEVVQATFDKSTAKLDKSASDKNDKGTTDAGKAKELNSENESNAGEKDEKSGKSEAGKSTQESDSGDDNGDDKGDKGPIPYNRFKEVNDQKVELETRTKEWEPIVNTHNEIVKYCEQQGITQEQFSAALEVQGLINTNPQEALKRLIAVVNELQGVADGKLPDDLQSEVDNGDLSEARAKEIAQLRAQKEGQSVRQKQVEQQQKQQQALTFQREVINAATSWDEAKRQADPDYAPKASENAPDGMYELVRDKYLAMTSLRDNRGGFVHMQRTVQDVVKLLDKAYVSVSQAMGKSTTSGRSNGAAVRKILSTSTASVNATAEPKDMKELVRNVAAKHGLSF